MIRTQSGDPAVGAFTTPQMHLVVAIADGAKK
jgi:hypothetical protein